MSDSWGNLESSERDAIRETARTMTDSEIDERFVEYEDRVTFKIVRKTDRALAGDLDITFSSDPADATADAARDGLDASGLEQADEVLEEQEVVEITLISLEDFDYEPEITEDDDAAAEPINDALADLESFFDPGDSSAGPVGGGDYSSDDAGADDDSAGSDSDGNNDPGETASLPAMIDHRPDQSPIKDQKTRGTCVSHSAMGLLEAFDHIPDDLSEQYTHYKFNEFLGRRHNRNDGLRTTDAAPFLARSDGKVCLESEWPYISRQSTINTLVADGNYGPPQDAVDNQTFGIGAYKIITDRGLTGESIKNTRYLEALLYRGYNIVVGTYVSWADANNDGILEPVLDTNGNPVRRGGHAMVMVGYDRTNQYFIVKNSWGPGWEQSGYGYLHYSLIRSCFKYGFVVDSVVPPVPSPLPTKLANAPFNASSISRTDLRAAVVFFKTSKGRFAVAEAYSGYNLYLRNLRVYNDDGSIHLQKDSLIVRGGHLCNIDSGTVTTSDADFWWQSVRRGVNYLVPRNGAKAVVAYNLAALRPDDISSIPMPSTPIPSAKLDYAIVVGRTTTRRRYKMLVHARPDNELRSSYLEVFNEDDSRYRYRANITVPPSWTYNLDTLKQGGGRYADIRWQLSSDDAGFLENQSWASTGHAWSL